MFSKFFIERPIFATVLSLIIVLAGLVAMKALPVEQYPNIVPTEIQISASYPGATAEVLADTVAAPIEQEVNGVQNMIYMYSTSTSSGYLTIGVVFDIGTDPDQATIDVNNKVQAATPKLPSEVTKNGVTVEQKSNSILQVVMMKSDTERYDTVYVSNYALLNVLDEIKRIKGVGSASLFASQDYSMRIWLSPDKLADHNLTPQDVITAIQEQNSQFAAGQFGQEPMDEAQPYTYSVNTKGRLINKEEFGFRTKNGSQVSVDSESLMLTGDENIVDIDFEVQWRINNVSDYLFNIQQNKLTIRMAAESAMREIIAKRKIDDALAGKKSDIEHDVEELLQNILDSYSSGIEIVLVQLLRVDPPSEVIDAFRDVQTAKADKEREINEAETYKNDILPKTRGQAEEIIKQAEGYKESVIAKAQGETSRFSKMYKAYLKNPKLTKKRIYLESVEKVMQDVDKIFIDKKLSSGLLKHINIDGGRDNEK